MNGARRWLNFGVSNFQAVEAVKLLYIVWLASYLVRFRDEVNATWKAMLKPLGVAVALVGLLILQPDFGSLSLILAITAGMLVLGGVNMPRMFGPVLIGLPILAAIAIAEPYRVRRFTSFLDPWADPFDSGYQLTNALMAVGRGEIFGVGLGASVQKLSYLPEAHTDFILAVIAEELGLFGVSLVIGLYALLAGRAFWVGLKCVEMRRHFAGYCAFGVALWMSLQSFVSIGVNLGLLPTKGLTLPLISSGGSSVLMTGMAVGLLLRVSYELDRAERQVARLRGEALQPSPGNVPATTQPPVATAASGERARHQPPAPARRTHAREDVRMTAPARVMILAGGTGGHIFPGLAVARALRARGAEVTWLGADGQMETRLVPQHDVPIDTIAVKGLRGKGVATLIGAPVRVLNAVRAAARVITQRRPRAVISFGGYAAGPGGVAARLAGIPLIVHEQNRAPGFTNRVLARMARRVLTGFPNTFATSVIAEVVGNPVREEIAAVQPPQLRMARGNDRMRLLVLGGSQGARALNMAVPKALQALNDRDDRSAPPVRREAARRCRRCVRAGRHPRARGALHRRHGRCLRVGRHRRVPRRCAHARRTVRRGRRQRAGAVPAGGRRPPDAQRRIPRRTRRGRVAAAGRSTRRPARATC